MSGEICIGIGTKGLYSQITANSILPETDEEYKQQKEEIEANMKLYAAAPEILEALLSIENDNNSIPKSIWEMRNKAINKALK